MSSSSDHPWIYDVFINFRGVDTRKTFVSHLYAALSNAGIHTFIDDQKLEKGEEVGPGLKLAIEGSQISIVVISRNYTKSKWCLNELVHIMECRKNYGHVVLPVFYGVEPSSIRNLNGDFEGALKLSPRGLESLRVKEELLKKWKTMLDGFRTLYQNDPEMKKQKFADKWIVALREVSNISGWDSSKFR